MGLNRRQITGSNAHPTHLISFSPSFTLHVSIPSPHLPCQEATTGKLSCCRKAFTGRMGYERRQWTKWEGSMSSRGAGVGSPPGSLSLNALRAGPTSRFRGGPPRRASGPSFMETPPLTWGTWLSHSQLPLLFSGTPWGGGGDSGGPFRKDERGWQYSEPRCVWGLQCGHVGDAGPKGDVQV